MPLLPVSLPSEWIMLADNYPDVFEDACRIDESLRVHHRRLCGRRIPSIRGASRCGKRWRWIRRRAEMPDCPKLARCNALSEITFCEKATTGITNAKGIAVCRLRKERSMPDKSKSKGKRKPFYPMPPMIPDMPENIARAVTRTPPLKDGWAYEREHKAKRGDA